MISAMHSRAMRQMVSTASITCRDTTRPTYSFSPQAQASVTPVESSASHAIRLAAPTRQPISAPAGSPAIHAAAAADGAKGIRPSGRAALDSSSIAVKAAACLNISRTAGSRIVRLHCCILSFPVMIPHHPAAAVPAVFTLFPCALTRPPGQACICNCMARRARIRSKSRRQDARILTYLSKRLHEFLPFFAAAPLPD